MFARAQELDKVNPTGFIIIRLVSCYIQNTNRNASKS